MMIPVALPAAGNQNKVVADYAKNPLMDRMDHFLRN
jgi:hypothetical protein